MRASQSPQSVIQVLNIEQERLDNTYSYAACDSDASLCPTIARVVVLRRMFLQACDSIVMFSSENILPTPSPFP